MSSSTLPIVVIHGVGTPAPGSEIQQLARGIRGNSSEVLNQTIHLDNFDVPAVLVSNQDKSAKLYEVNWADVGQPRRGVIGILLFFIRVQLAMMQLAESGWTKDDFGPAGPSMIGRLFRYVTLGGSFWVVIAPTSVLFSLVIEPIWLATLLLLAVFFFGIVVTRTLSRDDRLARFGYLWSIAGLILGLCLLTYDLPHDTVDIVIRRTAQYAGFVETLSGTLVLIGMIEALVRYWLSRHERNSAYQALVRSALYILPFSLLIGGIGSFLVACDLWLTQSLTLTGVVEESRLDQVLGIFADEANYNIPFMEVVNGTCTFLMLFSIAVAVVFWQVALRLGLASRFKWGNVFRGMIVGWLILLILLSLIVVIAYWVDISGVSTYVNNFNLNTIALVGWIAAFLSPSGVTGSALEVYKYSALRLTPVLFWAFPKLRGALDIVADVLFYLLPAWSPMSTAAITKSRLERCIELARSETDSDPIVLAYSQGSRIAVDLIREMQNPPTNLVTIGCPVGVLHGSFLGMPVDLLDERTPNLRWTNFYRDSDFIGGPVLAEAVKNRRVEKNFRQSHYNYYEEPDVVQSLIGRTGPLSAGNL
jgi:hypothetical protein